MRSASFRGAPALTDAFFGAGLLVLLECLLTVVLAAPELSGPWEARDAITKLVPIAWLAILPAAMAGAVLATLAVHGRAGRATVALSIGVFGGVVGWGVSAGRHFSAVPLRSAFVAVIAVAGAALAWAAGPRLAAFVRSASSAVAPASIAAAIVLEALSCLVLPRLYPAFHLGLACLTASLSVAIGTAIRPARVSLREARVRTGAAAVVLVALVLGARPAARRLALLDNLRIVFVDRAPLVGLGVTLAVWLSPPPPLSAGPAPAESVDAAPRIDWRGFDLLLVTIDAVRADHVGAYGYARPTTPGIDALAREGTVFEHAYCPTPHTSYSIVSLMTGKNMRPLLLAGLGEDSDTWAGLLRTYGFRTAAFYPPAVFFIDANRFAQIRDRQLDFEYARVEFAEPAQRVLAVRRYLAGADASRPLFLWVHMFEPHEPYVLHAEHDFGDRDIDRYDSEIAYADAGAAEIVREVRAERPKTVVIIASDHGEEFGDHGGHYHGTTVYDEQVRVPFVVNAPGLVPVRRVDAPVQTIDLFPTVLSAIDIPRSARIRGHDLARFLGVTPPDPKAKTPPAFSETADQTLLAEEGYRLVCVRRAAACALFDIQRDPAERRDLSSADPARATAMKAELSRIEGSHGQFESAALAAEGGSFPAAIRRAVAGDGDAAVDVAALLEDSSVRVRRKAAEVLFELSRKETIPALGLALSRDEDETVRRLSLLSLCRQGQSFSRAADLLADPDPLLSRRAALVLAEHGDARGVPVLLDQWRSEPVSFERAREIVAALATARSPRAVPALVAALSDVRLRQHAARALGAIGDPSARRPLLEHFAVERYQHARSAIADALVAVGARAEIAPSLARFLGTPDPLENGLGVALGTSSLALVGGPTTTDLERLARSGDANQAQVVIRVPAGGNGKGCRALVRARRRDAGAAGVVTLRDVDGEVEARLALPAGPVVEVAAPWPDVSCAGKRLRVRVQAPAGIVVEALAVVPLTDELPPPPPVPWHGPGSEQPD